MNLDIKLLHKILASQFQYWTKIIKAMTQSNFFLGMQSSFNLILKRLMNIIHKLIKKFLTIIFEWKFVIIQYSLLLRTLTKFRITT
jgi:hypothetical protein